MAEDFHALSGLSTATAIPEEQLASIEGGTEYNGGGPKRQSCCNGGNNNTNTVSVDVSPTIQINGI